MEVVALWPSELEVIGAISVRFIVDVGAVGEELSWLDKPFVGAHLLGGRLGEVVGDDLEVVQEEGTPALLVPQHNPAVLALSQDIGQVSLEVSAAMVFSSYCDGVVDNSTTDCGLNNEVALVPGGEVGRVEHESSVGVVLTDFGKGDAVVDLDTAIGVPKAIVAIGPVIMAKDSHVGEDSIEL